MSYFNYQRTLVQDVLRTSAGDVPWRYIEDHTGASSGRNFAEWVETMYLQSQYDNLHNSSVKLMLMFDLHVDSASKLH